VKYRHPLKQILRQTRTHWDNDRSRPEVRHAFRKALDCRTAALGAEVYASALSQLTVYHTCKSRACPSCGHRATKQWQRERWAALPDVPYKGITFTMPKELWQLFHANRSLAIALPALAASTIQTWTSSKHGIQVGIIAIPHSFSGRLEFNSHVHSMVTAGGLRASSCSWISSVYYDENQLMKMWKTGVIKLLRAASISGVLKSDMSFEQLQAMLKEQEERWWSVKVQSFDSRDHFLQYAGRYVRRPPIAQRRIIFIDKERVLFWTKDKRHRRLVNVQCSPKEFVDLWAQHIVKRYQHAIRCFGLFSPRGLSAAVFVVIGQKKRHLPRPIRWTDSIQRDFGKNPLMDRAGNTMRWLSRLAPTLSC
jgi:putative transposase/transposase-like zinc-binding protein